MISYDRMSKFTITGNNVSGRDETWRENHHGNKRKALAKEKVKKRKKERAQGKTKFLQNLNDFD